MVKEISKTIYICPYCDDKFENENQCEDHIDDCLDREYAKEDEEVIYECEFCKKSFDNEDDAEDCEEKHKESEDIAFSRHRLELASQHPNQHKLFLNKLIAN